MRWMLRAELAGREGANERRIALDHKIINILTGYIHMGPAAARPRSLRGVHSAATAPPPSPPLPAPNWLRRAHNRPTRASPSPSPSTDPI